MHQLRDEGVGGGVVGCGVEAVVGQIGQGDGHLVCGVGCPHVVKVHHEVDFSVPAFAGPQVICQLGAVRYDRAFEHSRQV